MKNLFFLNKTKNEETKYGLYNENSFIDWEILIGNEDIKIEEIETSKNKMYKILGVNPKLNGDLYIKNNILEIEQYAFYSCSWLTNIIIPNSVRKIGKYAFCLCPKVDTIKLGNGLKEIEDYAFANHTVEKEYLNKVIYNSKEFQTNKSIIEELKKNKVKIGKGLFFYSLP